MTIEIVDFPIKNGGSFHSYVSLPEGKPPFSYGFPMVFPWFKGRFKGFVLRCPVFTQFIQPNEKTCEGLISGWATNV